MSTHRDPWKADNKPYLNAYARAYYRKTKITKIAARIAALRAELAGTREPRERKRLRLVIARWESRQASLVIDARAESFKPRRKPGNKGS